MHEGSFWNRGAMLFGKGLLVSSGRAQKMWGVWGPANLFVFLFSFWLFWLLTTRRGLGWRKCLLRKIANVLLSPQEMAIISKQKTETLSLLISILLKVTSLILACENSRPSHVAPGAKKDGCFRRLRVKDDAKGDTCTYASVCGITVIKMMQEFYQS